MKADKAKTKYHNQLEKVKVMLEEFLQPWVMFCLEPYEILSLSCILLGESNKEVQKLEMYWDRWLIAEEEL